MEFLNRIIAYPLDQLPFVFLALVIAFSVHEFAHAYLAYRFGDDTAKLEGRVTLNPRKHLDVFGTILVFLIGFGWAKPVPVNRANFRRPKLMSVIVSLAGPISNLLMSMIGILLFVVFMNTGLNVTGNGLSAAIGVFLIHFLELNMVLFLFNLIPLPPLDGFRIVESIAPLRIRVKLQQYSQWGVFIFLLIVFIKPLHLVTIGPMYELAFTLINAINNFLTTIVA